MKALVLAAGKGVRMMPLTKDKPKAMVLFKGKPLLEYVLEEAEQAGITECGIVVGFKSEKITSYFGDKFREMKLKYFNQERQLGTAQAVSVAEEWLDGDFLLLSADILIDSSLLRKLTEKKGFAALLTLRHDDFPERYGVAETEGGFVKGIVEKPREAEKDSLVNAGVYRFSTKIFDAIRKTRKGLRNEFELTDSIRIMIAEKEKVGFVLLDGPCIDIGSIQNLELAEKSRL